MNTLASIHGSVPLSHWGLIRARGDDAVSFLQGQLTNDVTGLGASDVRLAGFCSAKGRLQASFVVWKPAPDEVMLACAASVLPATLKRLSMFVLRAKCKLSDASGELLLQGLAGGTVRDAPGSLGGWKRRVDGDTTLIDLPDAAGVARVLSIGPVADVPAATLALETWRWLEVQSGVPMIEAATVDQFVPQMLNYELIGGVDFQKGCYPGQEIVARSQYRGTIKRRMFLFDVDGDAAVVPAQEVFHSTDASQPAGMVVNAARRFDAAGSSALVEVKLAMLEGGSLHLGSPDGPVLRRGELPYALAVEVATPA